MKVNKNEYKAKSKQLDCIVKALKKLGYKVVEKQLSETSITFEVDYGWITLEYGYSEEKNPIKIWASE